MTVSSREQAWIEAGKIFPTDYDKDESSSERAGYPIFRFRGDWCTGDFANNWISDLGNRLEVNLASGESINIWIEKEKPEFTEYQLADALKVINEAMYQIEDNVLPALQDKIGMAEAKQKLYSGYSVIAGMLKTDYPESPLYREYNLQDA